MNETAPVGHRWETDEEVIKRLRRAKNFDISKSRRKPVPLDEPEQDDAA